MLAYTYVEQGQFALLDKPKPVLQNDRDAIVRVTLASICTSDLHIKHGSVPQAAPGITVGHEMVGVVEEVGAAVTTVKPGDRVTVNVETFCGQCFFCKHGWVNNCTDSHGGWALGCRIDGGQAEFVRVPYADQGLNKIPDGVSDRQALFVGDILATGFWATRISKIHPEDTVIDLRPAGEARTYPIGAVLVTLCNQVVLIPEGRAGTDDAHFSRQNAQNLRQLIDGQAPEPGAGPGDPFLGIRKQMGRHIGRGVGIHGSEFWHHKGFLVNANPLLPEQNRPRRIQLYNEGKQQHGNRQNQYPRKRQSEINQTFDQMLVHCMI